jgi:hypothetical protein
MSVRARLLMLGLLLLGLNALYLVGEAVFNSVLLDLVARSRIDPEELHRVELVGRSLAGFGAVLFVLATFGPRLKGYHPAALLGTLVLTFFVLFFGQKWVVDVYAWQSSAETRAAAKSMLWLKAGLARGYVEIEGVPMGSAGAQAPEDKTFLALIGWVAQASPRFVDLAFERRGELLSQVLAHSAHEAGADAYQEYQRLRTEVVRHYERYHRAAQDFERARAGDPRGAAGAWAQLNEEVLAGYQTLEGARGRLRTQSERAAKDSAGKMEQFFARYSACRTQGCRERLTERHYTPHMKKALGRGDVPPPYWCDPVKGRRPVQIDDKRIFLAPDELIGAIGDAITGKEHIRGYDCSQAHTPAAMTPRILHLKRQDFEQRTGYPYSLDLAGYLEHPTTHAKAREQLVKTGLQLPAHWTLDDRAGFERAYGQAARSKGEAAWSREMRRRVGEVLATDLSYAEFLAHPKIRQRIEAEIGRALPEGMDLEMSAAEFEQRFMRSELRTRMDEEIALLTTNIRALGEGGTHAEQGRAAVRALTVPYVALFFSAAIVLLTVAKSVLLILSPLTQRLPGIARLLVSTVLVVGVVLAVPSSLSNAFTRSQAFGYFMQGAWEQAPLVWGSSAYLMRLQPALAPIGLELRRALASVPAPVDAAAVQEHLRAGQAALAFDRLTTPEQDSALAHFAAVLELAPYHGEALAGLNAILTRYETLGGQARYAGRMAQVRAVLEQDRLGTLPPVNALTAALLLGGVGALGAVFALTPAGPTGPGLRRGPQATRTRSREYAAPEFRPLPEWNSRSRLYPG